MQVVVQTDVHGIDILLQQEFADVRETPLDVVFVADIIQTLLVDIADRDDLCFGDLRIILQMLLADDAVADNGNSDLFHMSAPLIPLPCPDKRR